MMIGLSRTHFPVTVLGHGTRAGIWLQGCSIGCAGCVSMDTWGVADAGHSVSVDEVVDWLCALPSFDGVTISGGEPFDQPDALLELTRKIRNSFDPERFDTLVFSGYSATVLRRKHRAVLECVDAVITGPYVAGKPVSGELRGSSNQSIEVCSALGSQRHGGLFASDGSTGRAGFQVAVSGGALWMIGIPAAGDMDQLETRLAQDGVQLEGTSWRC